MTLANRIDATIVAQAADWMVKLQDGPDARNHAGFERWRAASPVHAEAWRRMAEMTRSFNDHVGELGPQGARSVLESVNAQQKRRRAMTRLLTFSGAGIVGWTLLDATPWRSWTAGYSASVGEQREFVLADHTRLTLNTDSAVDIRFDAHQRRITLYKGEILVVSGHDPAGRPLHVDTRNGVVTPIGTRFTVRQPGETDQDTRVSVIEGAVEIRPANATGQVLTLARGQTTTFNRNAFEAPSALDSSSVAWIDGLLVARNLRLADFIDELARYRRGILRCDPSVGDLRVTGTFPLHDTDKVLRVIQHVLPVTLHSRTRYWVTLTQRSA
ncbi:FecR family protein [Caballeronia sp. LZ035]|uniref:FecR family protein n=1 Tax=Caballeronia sp. LZ035 TaxID=3038568 RepID=UPI002854347E|nr:FecR family protein [Caballeronia sp. LZ035]MDR5759407.1 FecR family protein [Caballeronia sp. LZ035]